MPRGGHNRKPDAVKELEGTSRKDRRNPNAPSVQPSKVPAPPKSMSKAERELWTELAGQVETLGTYAASDYSAFRLLVRTLALAEQTDQFMPPTARVRVLQAASSLLCGFGLTPASRSKVPTANKNSAPDADEVELFGVIEGGKA